MKAQILTIFLMLVISNFAYAKKCTTENVGHSPKGEDMNTTWLGPDLGYQVEYTNGTIKGFIKFYENRVEVKRNILVGISANGNVIIDDPDDDLGSWEVSCLMSDDDNYMTINGDYRLVFRSAFPAKYVQNATVYTKQNYQQSSNNDLGDWAPAPQAPKQYATPVQTTNGNKADMGGWAPSSK